MKKDDNANEKLEATLFFHKNNFIRPRVRNLTKI